MALSFLDPSSGSAFRLMLYRIEQCMEETQGKRI
jgi:hypothetical protein